MADFKIPKAPTIDEVKANLGGKGSRSEGSPERVFAELQELANKYKFLEDNLAKRKVSLEQKEKEIKLNSDSLKFLLSENGKPPLDVSFQMREGLLVKAEVNNHDEVYLWLGAGVIMKYPKSDAYEFLQARLEYVKEAQRKTQETLYHIKEQITAIEVDMMWVYNSTITKSRTTAAGA